MAFPETGAYVVPGALVPVEIDRERDEGLYVEPNVWMVHPGRLNPHGTLRMPPDSLVNTEPSPARASCLLSAAGV